MHRLNISYFFYISVNILSKILDLNGLHNLSILYFLVVLLKDVLKVLSGIIHLSLECKLSMILLSKLFVFSCIDYWINVKTTSS